ncbi:MAG: TonB-dependent receptor [Bacteroidota bacterium]
MGKFILFCLLFVCHLFVLGQTITVLSSKNKQPVEFAHVIVKPININIKELVLLTDSLGKAEIRSLYSNTSVQLVIACLGYEKISDTILLNSNKKYYLKEQGIVLNDIVITAQYSPNSPEKSVHKIRIIDRKKIDAMAAQNLKDVLTNEMDIRISQDNILGSSMSLQGLSGENIKILIDGVAIIGRADGNIDLSQINLNNIERIEIIEGPMSVSYGTNALAGTINLITKKTQQYTFETALNTYYESSGWYNITGKTGYNKNKISLIITGGRNFFDGWNNNEKIIPDFKPQLADTRRYQAWKPKEQYFTDLQYIYRFKNFVLNYKAGYFYENIMNRGYPRMPYAENAFDDYYRTYRMDQAVFVNGAVKNKNCSECKQGNINLQFTFNNYKRIKNTFFKDLTTLDQVLTENPNDQDTSKFNMLGSRGTYSTSNGMSDAGLGGKLNGEINYELGYDISVETAYGQRIKSKQQQIGDYALFTSMEYAPSEKIIVRPGLRYAYNTSYKAPIVPSLNLKYKLNNIHTLRFSYARGFRSPSLKELYFYFVDVNHYITGNELLKSENSHNFNLALNYFGNKKSAVWKTESSVFYNRIENLISLAQTAGTQYSYINIGLFKTTGAQLNVELAYEHFKFNIGGSYTGRYNNLTKEYSVKEFSWSPEARSGVLYEFKKTNFTIGIFYKYTGQLSGFMLDENNTVRQTYISDYHTADISVSKLLWKKRINITVGSKNLFDVKSINSVTSGLVHSSAGTSVPISTGRTYFIKLNLNINKK